MFVLNFFFFLNGLEDNSINDTTTRFIQKVKMELELHVSLYLKKFKQHILKF
jgi:hypothetical protein